MSTEPLTTTEVNNPPKKEVKVIKTLVEKATGRVKWYNLKHLYGFIHRDDVDEDIFVHKSAIVAYSSFASLKAGEEVEFKIVETSQGREAADVTGPGGAIVKGVRFKIRYRRGRGANHASNGDVNDGQVNRQRRRRPRREDGHDGHDVKSKSSYDEDGQPEKDDLNHGEGYPRRGHGSYPFRSRRSSFSGRARGRRPMSYNQNNNMGMMNSRPRRGRGRINRGHIRGRGGRTNDKQNDNDGNNFINVDF